MSSPQGLKSTLLFNPFPILVCTIRIRGLSHPPMQKNNLLPLCPHRSRLFCLCVLAPSSTCPGSRPPALSPRPSPGRPWVAPALFPTRGVLDGGHPRVWQSWRRGRRVESRASRDPGRAGQAPIGRPAPRGHPRCYIRPLFTTG